MNKITAQQAWLLYDDIHHGFKPRMEALQNIFKDVWASSDGVFLTYRTVFLRAAKLALAVGSREPFPSHNKQMALLLALTLLRLNSKPSSLSEEDAREILSLMRTRESEEAVASLADLLRAICTASQNEHAI